MGVAVRHRHPGQLDADAAPAIADLGIRVEAMDTIFSNPGVASNVAASALKIGSELRR